MGRVKIRTAGYLTMTTFNTKFLKSKHYLFSDLTYIFLILLTLLIQLLYYFKKRWLEIVFICM